MKASKVPHPANKILVFLSKNSGMKKSKLLSTALNNLKYYFVFLILLTLIFLVWLAPQQPKIVFIISLLIGYEVFLFYKSTYTKKTAVRSRNKIINIDYNLKELVFGTNCGKCILVLAQKLRPDCPLVFTVDGQKPRVSGVIDDDKVYFSFDVSVKNDFIEIQIGNRIYKKINPYKLNLQNKLIEWQTKGHSNELKMYVPLECIPHAMPNIEYSFDILVNHRVTGPYYGVLDEKGNEIIVKLMKIDKDFEHNECFLRPHFSHGVTIRLKKPKLILVNGKKI